MTAEEARERAIATIQAHNWLTPQEMAWAVLKAFGLTDWDQAAALMSGEAVVVQRGTLDRALSPVGGEGKTRAIAQVRNALAASPASEKETP